MTDIALVPKWQLDQAEERIASLEAQGLKDAALAMDRGVIITKLKAENAKLRDAIICEGDDCEHDITNRCWWLCGCCANRRVDENAKLREAMGAHKCIQTFTAGDGYPCLRVNDGTDLREALANTGPTDSQSSLSDPTAPLNTD